METGLKGAARCSVWRLVGYNTMDMSKKVILLVIDGLGVGAAPDAHLYGDCGSNTFLSVAKQGIKLPNTLKLLFDGCVTARLQPVSKGKDTTTGHFELAGLVLDKPFPTYPHGFPKAVIGELERAFGLKLLGNRPASGTQIIEEFGEEHLKDGKPIVYTSADSVLQIACHVKPFALERLYQICQIARDVMQGEHAVSRIIARPFDGKPGSFFRTANRKDFSLPPPAPTLLDRLAKHGKRTFAVGKVYDIFSGRGIERHYPAKDNREVFEQTLKAAGEIGEGLVFANFVDTDMLYGHRNDTDGFRRCVEELDTFLPGLLAAVSSNDLLIITADHGCDPATPSTDHSREYVPLIATGNIIKKAPLHRGTQKGFYYVNNLIETFFGIK